MASKIKGYYSDRSTYDSTLRRAGISRETISIKMFKIFHGCDDIDMHVFYFLQTNRTFFLIRCTIKHKCYFSQITAKWNSLPANVKYAPNSNIFKNSLVNVTKFIDQFYIFDG